MDKMKAISRLDVHGGGNSSIGISVGYNDFNLEITGVSIYDDGVVAHSSEGTPEPSLNVTINLKITDLPKEEAVDEPEADAP